MQPLVDARRLQGPECLRDLVLFGVRHGQLFAHPRSRVELLAPNADQALGLTFQLDQAGVIDADPNLGAPPDVVGIVPSSTCGRRCCRVPLLLGAERDPARLERLDLGARLIPDTGVGGGVLPRQRLGLAGCQLGARRSRFSLQALHLGGRPRPFAAGSVSRSRRSPDLLIRHAPTRACRLQSLPGGRDRRPGGLQLDRRSGAVRGRGFGGRLEAHDGLS